MAIETDQGCHRASDRRVTVPTPSRSPGSFRVLALTLRCPFPQLRMLSEIPSVLYAVKGITLYITTPVTGCIPLLCRRLQFCQLVFPSTSSCGIPRASKSDIKSMNLALVTYLLISCATVEEEFGAGLAPK